MTYPQNLKYTKDHEWVAVTGGTASVGITSYAIEQLGDIVYLDLPQVGATFEAGDSLGTVESTKTVSDIYLPLSGSVTEVNETLKDNPESLAKDPYTNGWFVKMSVTKINESDLMTSSEYEKYIAEC
jgi:glycine cleavage system H protein